MAIRLALVVALALGGCSAPPPPPEPVNPSTQTKEQAAAKSAGCLSCHVMAPSKPGPGMVDDPDMHVADARVGCTDCHGGDATAKLPEGAKNERPYGGEYVDAMNAAHVRPSYPSEWPTSANPERTYTLLNRENPEFVRFINPGDLRVAHLACGPCHPKETAYVPRSLMTTSAMFYSAATYNNGTLPLKN